MSTHQVGRGLSFGVISFGLTLALAFGCSGSSDSDDDGSNPEGGNGPGGQTGGAGINAGGGASASAGAAQGTSGTSQGSGGTAPQGGSGSAGRGSDGANSGSGGVAGTTGATAGGAGKGASGAPSALPGPLGRWVEVDTPTGDTLPDVTPIKLQDGRVLLIGGFGASSVYAFDPDDDSVETLGLLPEARGNFAAALLDDGRVLVAGGNSPSMRDGMTTCLLYDASDDTWTPTAELPAPRARQAALLLPDGDVLVMGGVGPGVGGVPVSDVYRYAGSQWETLPALSQTTRFHSLFPIAGERVLVVAENPQVYDLGLEAVTLSPGLSVVRRYAEAVQLPGGSVFAIGGEPLSIDDMEPFDLVDEFAPDATAWKARAELSVRRGGAGAVALKDGTVLVAGGFSSFTSSEDDPASKSAERYAPSADRWYAEAAPPIATGGTAVLLDDGSVLFVHNYLTRFYPEDWQ